MAYTLVHTYLQKFSLFKYRKNLFNFDPGDSLAYANGSAFTTSDQDNDAYPNNCANDKAYRGGWWYPSSCGFVSHRN